MRKPSWVRIAHSGGKLLAELLSRAERVGERNEQGDDAEVTASWLMAKLSKVASAVFR